MRSAPALDGLSLTRRAGRGRSAITGPSGCGKSTLLRVLLGLATPGAGACASAVSTCASSTLAAWHAQLAWVPQHPHLFAGTIADNVRLGRPDASPEAIWRALADARLADASPRAPTGLETLLGDRGAGLSAGERQRLALARAFLRDAPAAAARRADRRPRRRHRGRGRAHDPPARARPHRRRSSRTARRCSRSPTASSTLERAEVPA